MFSRNQNKKVTPAIKPFCKVCHDAGKTEKEYTSHFVKSEPGPNGKVVCPTLLNQVCRYCDNPGHTAGYCPIIAKNKEIEVKEQKMKARQEAVEKREAEKVAPKVVEKKKPKNMFAALDDSSSDTDDKIVATKNKKKSKVVPVAKSDTKAEAPKTMPTQKITVEEEFPALPVTHKAIDYNIKKVDIVGCSGYAAVTAKAPQYSEAEMKKVMAKKAIPPVVSLSKNQQEVVVYSYDDDWEEEEYYQPEPTVTASLTDWVGKKSWAEMSYEDDDEDW